MNYWEFCLRLVIMYLAIFLACPQREDRQDWLSVVWNIVCFPSSRNFYPTIEMWIIESCVWGLVIVLLTIITDHLVWLQIENRTAFCMNEYFVKQISFFPYNWQENFTISTLEITLLKSDYVWQWLKVIQLYLINALALTRNDKFDRYTSHLVRRICWHFPLKHCKRIRVWMALPSLVPGLVHN